MSTLYINKDGEASAEAPNKNAAASAGQEFIFDEDIEQLKRDALQQRLQERNLQLFKDFIEAMMRAHGPRLYMPDDDESEYERVLSSYLSAANKIQAFLPPPEERFCAAFKIASGYVVVRPEKIEFEPGPGSNKKSFTMHDAQLMAWQAAQNKSFAGGKNKIVIHGTRAERHMIALAIAEQNKFLPESQQLTIKNPVNILSRTFTIPRFEKPDFENFLGKPVDLNPPPAKNQHASNESPHKSAQKPSKQNNLNEPFKNAAEQQNFEEKLTIVEKFKGREAYYSTNNTHVPIKILGTLDTDNDGKHYAGVEYEGKPTYLPFEDIAFVAPAPKKDAAAALTIEIV